MQRIATVFAVGLAALVVAASVSASATAQKLAGTTGPGFTITLKKGSAKVKTLKAGKYTITVKDKSASHNFRLKGPGLNKQITSLGFVGTKTVTVTLKKGKYVYQCDPHVSLGMKGSFTVA
jgi:plastocyanin